MASVQMHPLQYLLLSRGWSRVDLEAKSGVHRDTISRHLSGTRYISEADAHRYAQALRVQAAFILGPEVELKGPRAPRLTSAQS